MPPEGIWASGPLIHILHNSMIEALVYQPCRANREREQPTESFSAAPEQHVM